MSNEPGGKGSAPRPLSDPEQYERNFDAIFRKTKDEPCDSKTSE